MKSKKYLSAALLIMSAVLFTDCNKLLDEPRELETVGGSVDYTNPVAAKAALVGAYQSFYDFWWEHVPILSVRGDDVNSGGGRNGVFDQPQFHDADLFVYDANLWMI